MQFSDDGEHIVYVDNVKDDDGDPRVVWSTRLDGTGTPVAPTSPIPPPEFYFDRSAFNGHDRLVFRTSGGFNAGRVYSVGIDGTGLVQLNPEPPTTDFGLAPNGAFVLFNVGSTVYGGPIDGTPAAIPIAEPGTTPRNFQIVSSSLALFRSGSSGSFTRIYSLELAPSYDLAWLNAPERAGQSIRALQVDPDGQQVVYVADEDQEEVFELYEVPTDGSAPRRALNTALPTGGDVRQDFTITSDGARVVYVADQSGDEVFELWGALLDSVAPPVRYNQPLPVSSVLGDVQAFRVAPDGARTVYLADVTADDFFDLHLVDDGHVRALAPGLSLAGDVLADFVFSPDGEHVVFQYLGGNGTHRLHAATTATPSDVELATSSAAMTFRVSTADGGRVVFRKGTVGAFDLYSAPLDGSAAPVALVDLPAGTSQSVEQFELVSGGSWVVYRADQDALEEFELFRVPVDGSAPATQLTPAMVANGDVLEMAVAADGLCVAYRADQDTDFVNELYASPADGSAPAVRVSGPMVAGGDVTDFAFTPDSSHLLYRADETVNNRFELYSAPSDGSGASVRLVELPAGNVETDFGASSDGLMAFYRASPAGRRELFAVPVDGSAAPVTLSGTLVALGNVTSFAVAPDGSRVVYLADARVNGVDELFSALPSGGAPTALVTLPAFADVTAYRIDAASQHVLYLANPAGAGIVELFRVPIDGSEAPERVHPPLPSGGAVMADFVPLAGGQVLYRADQETDEFVELYRSIDVDLDEPLLPHAPPTRSRSVVR